MMRSQLRSSSSSSVIMGYFFYCLLLCTTSMNMVVHGQFDGAGMGGEPKFCPPYRCPKDHEPVPKWPLKLTSSGCTGMGGMQVFSQTDAKSDPHKPCCDLRHACLQTCGSLKTFCDEEFLKCSKDVCEAMPDETQKADCEKASSINDLLVKMDQSCQRFDQEQWSHCECVKSKDVKSKRTRLLTNFYKKYAPENLDKVSALAEKATKSTSTMVGLLLKLYKKYPTAIQMVQDPQQAMMEQAMKDARNKKDSDDFDMDDIDEEDDSNADDLGTEEL